MKILIVGASGMIGRECLAQCLALPAVSRVVAFVRRPLAADVSAHTKLESIVVRDFAVWPKDVLNAHADAVGMIWAMGSYNGSITADLEYPMAFLEAMASVLEANSHKTQFRYVHLSGKFVRQDQDEKLWFLEKPRKIKGQLETRALEFAEAHGAVWKTFIVKPGGVVAQKTSARSAMGTITRLGSFLGPNWSVRDEELGAFMAYLATNGDGESPITENARIVQKGRELLQI